MKATSKFVAFLVLATMAAPSALAQHSGQSDTYVTRHGTQSYEGSSDTNARLESHIASCLILANLKEKELSKFAKENIDEDKVEDFAKKMVKSHGKMVSKLEEFAPHAASVKLGDDEDDDDSGRKRTRDASYGQDPVDRKLFTIQRRAAEKCLSLIKKEMEDKDSDKLAEAYLGQQIGAHIGMIAELTAAERSASGDLKEIIREAKKKSKDHLDEAKDLMKKIKKS